MSIGCIEPIFGGVYHRSRWDTGAVREVVVAEPVVHREPKSMSWGMVLRMYVSMQLSSSCESVSTVAVRLLKCFDNSLSSNGDGQTSVEDAKCIEKDGEYSGARVGGGQVTKTDS